MSEPEIVHPVPDDDVEGWMASLRNALLGGLEGERTAARVHNRRLMWQPDLAWGVRDHGAYVGSLAVEHRTLTVPGAHGAGSNLVAVDAVTGVSVAATHRRRGLLRQLITQSLRAAADRGDALSVLIAAEWPIYGRYGYAPAVLGAHYTYWTGRRGAEPAGGLPVRVRQVTTAELAALAPDVFERARRLRPGQMDRSGTWWTRTLALDGFRPTVEHEPWWVVHEDADGRPDGLLGWHPTRDSDLEGGLGAAAVDHFVAATDAAYRDLWAYLAGLDLIGEVTLEQRPLDEPVRWLLADGRLLQHKATTDDLWVRLLDVPAALAARGYALDGRLVLDVLDPDGDGFGAGRVALEVVDGSATCAPTTAEADLRLPQRALAAAYLGGHRLGTLAVTGELTELTPGALARADQMFATSAPPWNQTYF